MIRGTVSSCSHAPFITANEREVGEGIKASGVPREEIFLTTKLDNSAHRNPAEALQKSLDALETPYLDLCTNSFLVCQLVPDPVYYVEGLMHWPCPSDPKTGKPDFEWSWLKTWQTMEELYKANPDKLKAIGVSNISVDFMEELLKVATVVPAVNQIELHPYVVTSRLTKSEEANGGHVYRSCVQEDIVEMCRSKGIAVTAYSPLGSSDSPLMSNEVVKNLAEKHNVGPANILLSLQANRPGISGMLFPAK